MPSSTIEAMRDRTSDYTFPFSLTECHLRCMIIRISVRMHCSDMRVASCLLRPLACDSRHPSTGMHYECNFLGLQRQVALYNAST